MNGDGFQIGILFFLVAVGMGSCTYLKNAGLAKYNSVDHPHEECEMVAVVKESE